MRKILLLALLITMFHASRAQTWEIGAFAGASGYMGDLNPVKPLKFTNPAYGGLFKRNFNGYWSLKFSVLHGKIQADDARSDHAQFRDRNINFFSPLTEATFQVEFNLFNYMTSDYNSKRFSPFLFAGLGGVLFDPRAKYDNQTYSLRYFGTEGEEFGNPYRNYTYVIPYGAGVKYNFSGKWSITGELGYRSTGTDYLDDVSSVYAGAAQLTVSGDQAVTDVRKSLSDPSVNKIGAPGTQRGDFRKRDTYLFAGISLTYTFVSLKCPTF